MSTGANDHHRTRRPIYKQVELVLPLEVLEILRDLGASYAEAVTRLALRYRDFQAAGQAIPKPARSRPGPRVTGSGWGKGGAKVTGDAWFEAGPTGAGRAGPKDPRGSNTEPGRRAHSGRRKTLRDLFEQTPFRLRVIHRNNGGSWTGAVIAQARTREATVTTLILDLGDGSYKRVEITEHTSGRTESRPRFYALADPTYRSTTARSGTAGQAQAPGSMDDWKLAMREARERMAAAHPDKGGPGGEVFVRAKARVDELKSRRPDPFAAQHGNG
jgi:hypothetical protein